MPPVEVEDRPFHFLSLVCRQRQSLLHSTTAKRLILQTLREARMQLGIRVASYVILDDHCHFVFQPGPRGHLFDIEFLRDQSALLLATHIPALRGVPLWNETLRMRKVEYGSDLRSHLDLVHYDPVRHGLVDLPAEYPWSSLPSRIRQGHYPEDWGRYGPPASLARLLALARVPEMGGPLGVLRSAGLS